MSKQYKRYVVGDINDNPLIKLMSFENEREYNEHIAKYTNVKHQMCECCKLKPIRYKLFLEHDVICPFCDYVKHKKQETQLFLCSTKCSNLYWVVDEYLSKKTDTHVKIMFCMYDDECNACGRATYPSALFVGTVSCFI